MPEVATRTAAKPAPWPGRADRSAVAAEAADPAASAAIATALADQFVTLDLPQRLATVRAQIFGRVVFTTSFGLEDQAITHAIFSQGLAIDVVTLDTGRLFPETHEVWAATERRYGVRVLAFAPEHGSVEALIARQGIDGLRFSVAARLDCCDIRNGRGCRGANGQRNRRPDGAAARAGRFAHGNHVGHGHPIEHVRHGVADLRHHQSHGAGLDALAVPARLSAVPITAAPRSIGSPDGRS